MLCSIISIIEDEVKLKEVFLTLMNKLFLACLIKKERRGPCAYGFS